MSHSSGKTSLPHFFNLSLIYPSFSAHFRVLWCATPPRCTAPRMGFSSTRSAGCWVGPFRPVSLSRSWERTTPLRTRRTRRSALWAGSGSQSPGLYIFNNLYLLVYLGVYNELHGVSFERHSFCWTMNVFLPQDKLIRRKGHCHLTNTFFFTNNSRINLLHVCLRGPVGDLTSLN